MFPRHIKFAALAVDAVALTFIRGTLCVRLITASVPAFKGKRALPGALIRPHETAQEAAMRVLKEKAGIRGGHMEQVHTFSRVNRDPRGRVVAVAYLALLPPEVLSTVTDREAHTASWVPLKKVPHLAYDHDEILEVALARLRGNMEYTDIIRHFLPRVFTLTELQEVHETILNKNLDKRNFRKKILAQKVLKETGKTAQRGAHRPAALYTFVKEKHQDIDMF